jgi:DNA-binding LytR/AlgR family response regulator
MNDATVPLAVPFRVVLLDDDDSDREHFRFLLRRHPAFHLVGEASTFKEALALVTHERADVLILESEIGGRSVIEECPLIPSSVKLIFLTRHQKAAVQAFDLDAVDFLLKPLASPRFTETVRRLLRLDWKRPSAVEAPPSPNGMVLIPFERGRRGASLDEISLIQAFGNYTRVSLGEGKSEIVLRSLSKWEQLLPSPPFLRVHRNTIVHSSKVQGLEEEDGGTILRMADADEKISVSRRCLPEVRHALFATRD